MSQMQHFLKLLFSACLATHVAADKEVLLFRTLSGYVMGLRGKVLVAGGL